MDRETVEEIKRHFGIVVEDVRSDVRGVAEGVDALRDEMHREIGAVRGELGSTREELGSQIRAVAENGHALQEEFGGLREEFGGLRGEFGGLREEFADFRGSVAEQFEETRSLVRLSYGHRSPCADSRDRDG